MMPPTPNCLQMAEDGIEPSLRLKLNKFEIQFVTSSFTDKDFQIDMEQYRFSKNYKLLQDLNIIMKNVSNNDFEKVMNTQLEFSNPLKTIRNLHSLDLNAKEFHMTFGKAFEECSYIKQLILLLVGVSALQIFIKANLCGPTYPSKATIQEIYNRFLPCSDDIRCCSSLVYPNLPFNVSHSRLLVLSFGLLSCSKTFNECLTHKWWLLRCSMIYQKILPDNSSSLQQFVCSLIQSQAEEKFLIDKSEPLAAFMFSIECAQFYLQYNELSIAEPYIMSAQSLIGFGARFCNPCMNTSGKPNELREKKVFIKRNDERYKSNLQVNEIPVSQYLFIPSKYSQHNLELNGILDTDSITSEELLVLLLYSDLLIKSGFGVNSDFCKDLDLFYSLALQSKLWSLSLKALVLRLQSNLDTDDNEKIMDQFRLLKTAVAANSFSNHSVLYHCLSLPMMYDIFKLLGDKLVMMGSVPEGVKIYCEFNLFESIIAASKKLDDVQRRHRDAWKKTRTSILKTD